MRTEIPKTPTMMILALLVLTLSANAATMMPDYQASYTITRDGKATAEQKTTFKQLPNGSYLLKDVTKGTHGLASFTGFERTETTQFGMQDQELSNVEHKMKQEVAFKSKSFKYTASSNSEVIKGKHKKKNFTVNSQVKPISSHMLPWWLSIKVCKGHESISVPVMKSNRIKTYHFKVTESGSDLIRVDRLYEAGVDRSTTTWLDPQSQCFPVRTRHQEGDDPVIETTIKQHPFKNI